MAVHNNVDDTYRAVRSIMHQVSPLPYELVLVDDGSSDQTPLLFRRLLGARTARFEETRRYALANNFAVFNLSNPASTYIWFLNNDLEMANTKVLASLLTLLGPSVGAVGGQLVLPSGKLQEAGSFLWRDGHSVGHGRDADPSDPAYTYVRDVDFCSAANLLMWRSVFHALNGFDASTFPMYFEDTDLQMRIRYVSNLSILYQPLAVVNHREHGSSSRRHAQKLIKRARVVFIARWMRRLLEHHFANTPSNVLCAKNRRPGLRLLLIDHTVLDASYGADYTRSHALLSAIVAAGHMLTVFPYADKRRPASVTDFEQMGIEFCCFKSSASPVPLLSDATASASLSLALATFLRARSQQFDAIIVSHADVFAHALPVLKKHAGGVEVVFNAETFGWQWFYKKVELEGEQDATIWAEEQQRRRIELFLHCKQAWLLSAADEDVVRSLPHPPRLWQMQHGLRALEGNATLAARSALGFAGVFRSLDGSDAEAVMWFLDNVWRAVVTELPGTVFVVGGASPPPQLTVLAGQAARRMTVTGAAPDASFYASLRVFVLPHQYGAHLHNKIVEALAQGVPCVLMRTWAAPLGLQERASGVLLADDAKGMASAILQLWRSEGLWHELSAAALEATRARAGVAAFQERVAQSLALIPRSVCVHANVV